MHHRFHPSCRQEDCRKSLYEEESTLISFADVFLLKLLQHHHIKVLFGEERRLPAAYCGLSALVGHKSSPFLTEDYYLQLDLDFNVSSLARVMDFIWSHLQRQSHLFSSAVLCSAPHDEGTLISPFCDGKFLFSSVSVAQTLLNTYTEALGGRVPDWNTLSVAKSQPLSEDDKLSRLQGCLQILSHGSLLELPLLDGDSGILILSEPRQPVSRDESHEDLAEVCRSGDFILAYSDHDDYVLSFAGCRAAVLAADVRLHQCDGEVRV